MKQHLVDNHDRRITYLRLAVTDTYELRCNYCLRKETQPSKKKQILSYEDLLTLLEILCNAGIEKVRITGAEPFAREDLIPFLKKATNTPGLKSLSVATNATLIGPYIKDLKQLGILEVNMSLDALDKKKFFEITKSDLFDTVYENLRLLMDQKFHVTINCIVWHGKNIDQIFPMIALTENHPISVRFLEEMPFNGPVDGFGNLHWNHQTIYSYINAKHRTMIPIKSESESTYSSYRIPGHLGSVGIIPAYNQLFCKSCDRIRISAEGHLSTCLYGKKVTDFRPALNKEHPEREVKKLLYEALGNRWINGHEAELANDSYA